MAYVISEVQQAHDSGVTKEAFYYPLDREAFDNPPALVKRQEIFAQLVAMYLKDSAGMKAALPVSHKFIERAIKNGDRIKHESGRAKPWVRLYVFHETNGRITFELRSRGGRARIGATGDSSNPKDSGSSAGLDDVPRVSIRDEIRGYREKNKIGLIDTPLRIVTQAVGVDKLTRGLLDLIKGTGSAIIPETIKAGVVADYGLNDAVIDRRDMMYSHQATQLRGVQKLLDKLSTLTRAESAILYEAATTSDPAKVDAN